MESSPIELEYILPLKLEENLYYRIEDKPNLISLYTQEMRDKLLQFVCDLSDDYLGSRALMAFYNADKPKSMHSLLIRDCLDSTQLGVVLHDNNLRVLGFCGMQAELTLRDDPDYNIYTLIDPRFQGQGYGRHLRKALILLGLSRPGISVIRSDIHKRNEKSLLSMRGLSRDPLFVQLVNILEKAPENDDGIHRFFFTRKVS